MFVFTRNNTENYIDCNTFIHNLSDLTKVIYIFHFFYKTFVLKHLKMISF